MHEQEQDYQDDEHNGCDTNETDELDEAASDSSDEADVISDDSNATNENDSESLQNQLAEWAIKNSIRQHALRSLVSILNPFVKETLPKDPRTMLNTPKTIAMIPMGRGKYWHFGLEQCLRSYFDNLSESMECILSFNIDGLPIGKSTNVAFWPILCMVNIPHFKPMTIGIWCGKQKPLITEYLRKFIDELKYLLDNPIEIKNNIFISIKIGTFVCDSPARSYLKNTIQFNGYHGCQLCEVVGEYNINRKRMSFPDCNARLRTNADFRNRVDEAHHFDIVASVITADELHLLHLGVVRKLLFGWVIPKKSTIHKWTRQQIADVQLMILRTKLSSEIHHALRSLDSLKMWKGLEFRNFLMYAGLPAIMHIYHHNDEIHKMFLCLFAGTTICSSPEHSHLLDVAEQCFVRFVMHYQKVFGRISINSNVHNSIHIVQQVRQFGILSNFSAYPYENELYHLKRKVRHGNKPLEQAARRILESMHLKKFNANKLTYPIHSKEFNNEYKSIEIKENVFFKKGKMHDSWFLTNSNEIIPIESCFTDNKCKLLAYPIKKSTNLFTYPINSMHLNIFKSDKETGDIKMYDIKDIKCKLVNLETFEQDNFIFIPLLHSQ